MYRLGNRRKIGIHTSWVDQCHRLHAYSASVKIQIRPMLIYAVKNVLLRSVLPGGRRGGAPGEHQGLRISACCRLRELHPRVGLRGREVSLPL